MKNILKKISNDKGQDLMEFAITLPILAMIFIGIFDLGRAVYYYSVMQNAAREGARTGIVNPWDEILVESVVRDRALGINPSDLTVDANYTCKHIKVYVEYSFDPFVPFIPIVDISTSSQLQRERWLAVSDDGCDPSK